MTYNTHPYPTDRVAVFECPNPEPGYEGIASVLMPTGETDPDELFQRELGDKGIPYTVINKAELPKDRLFRNAWRYRSDKVEEDYDKAKAVAHNKRREKRAEEFKPHDETIAKAIPGQAAAAEAERAKIRTKYDAMQVNLDTCPCVDTLREKCLEHGLDKL